LIYARSKSSSRFFSQRFSSFDLCDCTFEREFTIDWLEELLEMKASQILLILEEGIQQGWLTRKKPGIYLFENIKKTARSPRTLPQK